MPASDPEQTYRLDSWLWAARFFKTRALAAHAIDAGRVEVNGEPAKRARRLHVGDHIRIRQPPFEQIVEVLGLSDRRGPAAVAATLYRESEESIRVRERLKAELRASQPLFSHGEGKPGKKDRRALRRLKRRD